VQCTETALIQAHDHGRKVLTRVCVINSDTEKVVYDNLRAQSPIISPGRLSTHSSFSRTHLRSKFFWSKQLLHSTRNNDSCRRAAPLHVDEAFDNPAGLITRIGSTCPQAFAPTLHQQGTGLLPPARPTSQAGTGMAHLQMARAHYTGSRAWRAQSRRGRACMHRSTQSED
jgi:hypothetical protein